jgi:tRNA-Thr(GGU) m(6)t(6)A37 methyltransferase TsaA
MPSHEEISLRPIGVVRTASVGNKVRDRNRLSQIILENELVKALGGIEEFSHIFVIFWLHKISKEHRQTLKVHPRGRRDMSLQGIFATRTMLRPNPIGLTLVELVRVEGRVLTVRGLDAIDGTPVLDIKPFDPWDMTQTAKVPRWWIQLKDEKD